jgi:predicted secreted protein
VSEPGTTGGDVVEMAVGDEFVLRVPENGTTGYVWSVATRGSGVEVVEDRSVPSAGAVGAAGEHVVRVRAVSGGSVELILRLARAWEHTVADERRVVLRVSGPP